LSEQSKRPDPASPAPVRLRRRRLWFPAVLAAAVVLALWGPNLLRPPPPAWTVYKAVMGQIRRVVLADKSVMRLNGASTVRIVYEDSDRRAAMGEAEAAFAVTQSARRPFLITSGDRTVRIDGGEVNVLRQTTPAGSTTVVTVRHGQAKVFPVGQSEDTGLTAGPGQQVTWVDGQPDAAAGPVRADNAFAWESRQLAYDQAPLKEVVADLNRYVLRPIRLADPSLDALPFTGVIALQGEDAMLRKIEAKLPVQSQPQPSTNEIILRRLPACGYKNCDKPGKRRKPNPLVQSLLKLNKPQTAPSPTPLPQPAPKPAPAP
jgi:transmembrane sensor